MIQLWVITFATGLLLGYMIAFIQIAHGAQNTTVSVPVPIMVPTLQYSPSAPPVTPQPQPQNANLQDITIPLITSIVGIVLAKLHSDSKASSQNKESMAAILQNKQVQAELARVMYSLNPEKANAINDAPAVKLETLNNDVKDFADKAAKA